MSAVRIPIEDLRRTIVPLERLEAAKRLQELGWALVRYGQRVERCCKHPGPDHEHAALVWRERALQRMTTFARARDTFRAVGRLLRFGGRA